MFDSVDPQGGRANLPVQTELQPALNQIRVSCAAALMAALLLTPVASAQSEGNLPPVAAPTSRVQVDAIPVVRSDAQKADDFTAGLLRGLRVDSRISGVAVSAVQEDHTIFQRSSGALDANTQFPANGLERVIHAAALLQLIEAGQLKSDSDIGQILHGSASGVTLAGAMTRQVRDDALIAAVIAKVSARPLDQYLTERIFRPLGMTATMAANGNLRTSLVDMTRFAAALANGEAASEASVLPKDAIRTPGTIASTSGWGFGLPEMRRNGWVALQLDGSAGGFFTRFVFAPEAKLAYLIVLRGGADARSWRVLDEALFDQLLPSRAAMPQVQPSPSVKLLAGALAGTYGPDPVLRSFVFLKFPNRDLRVSAGANNSLVLSGAENATLMPGSGGNWSARDGSVSASYRDGELFLSSGAAYRPVAFYQRPVVYALLALVAALAVIGAALSGRIPLRWPWFQLHAHGMFR